MKTISQFLFTLTGGVLGSLMGCYRNRGNRECNSAGACLFTANTFRRAVWGGFIGALLGLTFMPGGVVAAAADSPHVVEIKNAREFDAKIAENKIVVVDFYAEWCPPCKKLSPIISKLANEYAQRVSFLKVNIDENKELAAKFKVEGIPCVVFFKDGQESSRIVGLRRESDYRASIEKLLK